jgi:signal transduction histidine kinase/DNA-binding response OmpR family regulator
MTDETAFGDVFQGGGELGALMRTHDWATTPLGPVASWPQSLKSVVRMMLTSRYQMWMAWGPDLTYVYNDAYAPTLGIKHPWGLGKSARQVWTEIWPEIGPLIDQVMTTGEATFSEGMLLFLQRSGFPEETYHTFSYSPLFDDQNQIAGLFCVVVEETVRVINERRLGTLRTLASTLAPLRNEPELFAAVEAELSANLADLPFTLVYLFDEAHQTARRVARSGIDAEHPAARETLEVEGVVWPLAEVLEHHKPVIVENLFARFPTLPSGAWQTPPKRALLVPIAEQGHEAPAGVLIVGLNPYRTLDQDYRGFVELLAGQIAAALAATRALEQERKRAEALAEIDRAKTAFFSNVSHEFRTPLTLMLGPLEDALASEALTDAAGVRTQVELAHRNGLRLLRLVNSLLDFSRIEAGRVRASFQPTDLSALSAALASSFRSAVERAGLALVIDAPPLPEAVFVDPEMWEKILLNLLSNAFKFTAEGQITVEVKAKGAFAEVTVRDTGIGVPPEELPRLFERFHRVEGAQGRSIEGSGIGLALVQELVALHGGTIAAQSEPGKGAAFIICIPFGSEHLPQDQLREAHAAPAGMRLNAYAEEALRWSPDAQEVMPEADEVLLSAPTEGAGGRVLLADDNQDMRAYVRRLLEGRGYTVEAVADGEAALRAAQATRPDLILSDVMMPKLDGFGLLKAVRADLNLAGTPFLMLSARAGEEAKVEGLDAGADDYLVKPFAARELLARVAVNLQMAKLRRETARAVMQSEQRFLLSEERLAIALATGRIAIFEFDMAAERATVLGPLVEFFGVDEAAARAGLPLEAFIKGIDPEDRPEVEARIWRAVETGEFYEAEFRLAQGPEPRRVVARGRVQTGVDGVNRLVGAVIDISEEKLAQDELRRQSAALETLNQAGSAIAADLDLDSLVQTVTDAGVQLTGAEFGAFFYNRVDEEGERYMLYTLSGAHPSAFSSFPMPKITGLFAPTFSGERIVRSGDIAKDPRYGGTAPFHGMPKGHLPVRSYLAVPVKSRGGEVLGGLLFGHSEPDVFNEAAEHVLIGLAAQTAVAIDNSRLFQASQREIEQRRAAEAKLQALNTGLEERVAEALAERAKVEDALRQAQKMEAVGQLTGGVAHDFNNLLTVIIGGLDTIRRNAPGDNARLARALDMASQGASRAVTLTSRLLAFSRRQPLEPKPIDLNAVMRDSTELLHRTLGEPIELEAVLAPRLWPVEVDQNQLESAILNLAVNARDAMPNGGKLTIETGNAMLDERYVATDSEVTPGQYAMISVSDSGEGMSKEVIARAFEPFYTTKEVGKGTGLGLSMVYGFVKQSGGHIMIYSEAGHGTTVKLYFPRYRGALPAAEAEADTAPKGVSNETVLVVEDNDEVRAYSVSILTELGYQVIEAADAEQGLAVLRRPGRIDLLFTDVVLPGKSGRVLADEAMVVRPELKVLFTTGYSRNAIVHQGRLDAGVNLITKPFTFDQLAKRLRDVLDG